MPNSNSAKLASRALGRTKLVAAALVLALASAGLAACSSPEEKSKAYYESGQKYLEEKDFARAAIEFRNALKVKQDYADAWFGMAQVEEHDKNWNLVAGDLNKVLEINPKHEQARAALARLMLLGGNAEQALKNVEAGLTFNPKDAGLMALKAAVLLKMSKSPEAVEAAKKALELDPKSVDAMMVLASERLVANDFAGAQQWLNKGVAVAPDAIGLQLFALSLYEKKGDLAAQENALRRIIAINPAQSGYRQALVMFLSNNNRYDEAEKELRAAADSNPQDIQANLDLVRFIASLPGKGTDAAAAELNRLVASGSNVAEYKSALAQLNFELGKYDDTQKLLKEVIDKEGISEKGINARLDLAGKFIMLKRFSDAEPLVTEALANDARNVEGLRQRAALRIANNDLEQAANDLRAALNEAPSNPALYQMMAAVNERSGSIELADKSMSDALRVSKYNPAVGLDYARFLLRRGQAERAESVLTDILEIAPGNIDVMTMLADLKLRRQDWVGAQQLAEALSKGSGNKALSNQIAAAALVGQNKLDEGIRVLLNSNAGGVATPQAKFALVKAYLRGQKYKEAEDYLKTLLLAEPNNADARTFLGIVQLNTNRKDLAKMSFEAAIAADPASSVGYRALADYHVRDGQFDLAMAALKDGLSKAPKDMDLRLALASLFERKGDIDSAIGLYHDMLKDQPDSMIAANNYASLVSDYKSGDAASLEKAATAAAVLRGSPIAQFKDTLGWILYLRGQHKEALDLLKQSTADLPDLALTNYHLGKAYEATGDAASAKASLERALKLARPGQERTLIEGALKAVAPAKASN